MEANIKAALGLSHLTIVRGQGGGGCISQGDAYDSDKGMLFVKKNNKQGAKLMFEGELESLKAIAATQTLRVPQPLGVVPSARGGGAALVMEFLDMHSLTSFSEQMGTNLANLHMHNELLRQKRLTSAANISEKQENEVVENFGFHIPTCCGYLAMDNSWKSSWPTFYACNRLEPQIKRIQEKHGDRELEEIWSELQLRIPLFFQPDIEISPALLHGDLWSGNAAQTAEGPVAFDPAAFYGHHEFDLAIAGMFGGFSRAFYNAYHLLLPKQSGFERRHDLYVLFHQLNHWNHFGIGYRESTLDLARKLLKN